MSRRLTHSNPRFLEIVLNSMLARNVRRRLSGVAFGRELTFALCLGGLPQSPFNKNNLFAGTDETSGGSPEIGKVSQSAQWGKIDENVPPTTSTGDTAGTCEPARRTP